MWLRFCQDVNILHMIILDLIKCLPRLSFNGFQGKCVCDLYVCMCVCVCVLGDFCVDVCVCVCMCTKNIVRTLLTLHNVNDV